MSDNEITDLRPDPDNANRGTPRGHGIIEQSIRRHGAGRSGLAANDGTMIAGSQTLEEMAALGIPVKTIHTTGKEWIVVVRDDIEPGSDEARLMAVEDNRASELGLDWNPDVLDGLIADGIDLSTLFRDRELPIMVEEIAPGAGGDDFDTTPEDGPTRTQSGDLWQIGPHRLLVGDCTDPANVERLMGGERIDRVFTSPPYDQQRTYEGNMSLDWRALVSGALLIAVRHCGDNAQLFVNLGLVHRDGRVIRYWDALIDDLEDAEWPLFGWYVWDKQTALPVDWHGRFPISHEWIFHFARSEATVYKVVSTKNEGKSGGNSRRRADGMPQSISNHLPGGYAQRPSYSVVTMSPSLGGRQEDHPAPFPAALPEMFMRSYGGDVWYEPFCGSGTSIIAAHRTARRCYSMEISPKYCDVILRRASAEGLDCVLLEHQDAVNVV